MKLEKAALRNHLLSKHKTYFVVLARFGFLDFSVCLVNSSDRDMAKRKARSKRFDPALQSLLVVPELNTHYLNIDIDKADLYAYSMPSRM